MTKKIFLAVVLLMASTSACFAYDFSAVSPSGHTLYYNIVSGNAEVTSQNNSYDEYYTNYPTGNLVIPSSVANGGSTFNVTSISQCAFYGCSGLTSVTIPSSVTSIGDSAFYGCNGLTSVNYTGTIAQWCGIDFSGFSSNPTYHSHTLSINGSPLTDLVIPEGVTEIKPYAFYGCSGLISVTIPNSVTSIGNDAFYYCSGLTSVTIPNSVTSIGDSAFSVCIGLTSVTIPDSVTSIGAYAFAFCSGLASVNIGNSVTSIGFFSFYGCSGLTSITVATGNVNYDSRNNCNAIIETADNRLSVGCQTTVIPNSVTSIGDYAFNHCSGLISVTIPDSVTSIGEWTFSRCSGLTSVTIPNSVTSIGEGAFYYCSGLTSVTIGNSVTSIGSYAFYYCSGLRAITSLAITAPTIAVNTFFGVLQTRPVFITCGSLASYQTTWSYFSNFIFMAPSINISVGVVDSTFGVSNVTDGPNCDSTVVIVAVANHGYHFDHWSNGSTANPDTITLMGDSTVTAYFDRNEYQLTLNSADPTLGNVSGSGIYLYLDTANIVAEAIEHHHLLHWSDGDRNATRDIVITADLQLTATFAIDTHTVSVTSSDIARGMVQASDTEFAYGTPCTVTATAYTGYTFAGWSNGVTANPYTFAVLSDVELTALFVAEGEEVYTVTVVSADPSMGTVSGGGQAMSGGEVTIRAISNPGYHFLRWNDNSTDSVRTVTVTANATYTAYFEANNVGIDDADAINAKVYSSRGHIVVEGANGNMVTLYDITGRVLVSKQDEYAPLRFDAPASGTYMIKIGNYPARKVVVIR